MIAALALDAGYKLEQISKDSKAIEARTEELGNRVAARTIELHLKRARALVQLPNRDS